MKHYLFLLLFTTPLSNAFPQQTAEWLKKLDNPEFAHYELRRENVISSYLNHDFSSLLTPEQQVLGYIGRNFRRIKVNIDSVVKSPTAPNVYLVSGSTVVSDNKCDFRGTITVEGIREFKQLHYGVDDMYKDEGIQSQGILIGKYTFSENPKQRHVGIFRGVMTLWWYLDRKGTVRYDNIESHSDRFRNNQYVGTWTEYGKQEGRPCNWGEYRIPFSNDLDIGAGEFAPNPKYYHVGWSDFSHN